MSSEGKLSLEEARLRCPDRPDCIKVYAADMETVVRTLPCVGWCPLLRRTIKED